MKDKTHIRKAREVVKSIISDYKSFMTKTEIKQSLTVPYDRVKVAGNYNDGQAVINQILDKADRDTFIANVDDILRNMPSTFRRIILYRFYREWRHDDIIEELGIDEDDDIARTTYFRWFDYAVIKFYNEVIARMTEIKVGK